jgi:hypothetical protein
MIPLEISSRHHPQPAVMQAIIRLKAGGKMPFHQLLLRMLALAASFERPLYIQDSCGKQQLEIVARLR